MAEPQRREEQDYRTDPATQYRYLLERINSAPSLTAGVLLKSPPSAAKRFWASRRTLVMIAIPAVNVTCCRGCLAKWRRIPQGQPLTPEQINYIIREQESTTVTEG
ncbi:MAG: DUF4186 family protein [Thermoguttaceae bacterium]